MMSRELPSLFDVVTAMSYDPYTGVITWRHRDDVPACINGRYAGKPAGKTDAYGYKVIRFNKQTYLAHRLAYLLMEGHWPTAEIDHIDGAKSNNAWKNLRIASRSENMRNRPGYGASGFKGVTHVKSSGKWQAQIFMSGKQTYLGAFDTAELAHAAYLEKSSEIHGEFAHHKSQQVKP
jgi:hypothetical protein